MLWHNGLSHCLQCWHLLWAPVHVQPAPPPEQLIHLENTAEDGQVFGLLLPKWETQRVLAPSIGLAQSGSYTYLGSEPTDRSSLSLSQYPTFSPTRTLSLTLIFD